MSELFGFQNKLYPSIHLPPGESRPCRSARVKATRKVMRKNLNDLSDNLKSDIWHGYRAFVYIKQIRFCRMHSPSSRHYIKWRPRYVRSFLLRCSQLDIKYGRIFVRIFYVFRQRLGTTSQQRKDPANFFPSFLSGLGYPSCLAYEVIIAWPPPPSPVDSVYHQ